MVFRRIEGVFSSFSITGINQSLRKIKVLSPQLNALHQPESTAI